MRLNVALKLFGKSGKLLCAVNFSYHKSKLFEVVLRNFKKECVHNAFAEVVFKRNAPLLPLLFKLFFIKLELVGCADAVFVKLKAVVPVCVVEKRKTVLADGNLCAVFDCRPHRIEYRTFFVRACNRVFFGKKSGVAGVTYISVYSLNEPELVVGAVACAVALPVEVMVCVSVLVNILHPLAEHMLCKLRIAHCGEVIERGIHILNFTEADLAEGLLRPRERA